MTKAVYQSMFISLSALLLAALFVLQPTSSVEMKEFKSGLAKDFSQAATELVAGESFTEPFALVWSSVSQFYSESADQAVALLNDSTLANVALMFNGDYLLDREIAAAPRIARATDQFEQEEALLNIVPDSAIALREDAESLLDPNFNEGLAYVEGFGGKVAGESIDINEQPRVPVVWLTVSDSITGYPYCVAIFNGTINSYPGACATENLSTVYEN